MIEDPKLTSKYGDKSEGEKNRADLRKENPQPAHAPLHSREELRRKAEEQWKTSVKFEENSLRQENVVK